MLEGVYTNAASIAALERWQETISQNLASSKVAGFKKAQFAIESDDRLKTEYEPEAVMNARHNGHVPTRTTQINFAPGEIQQTGKETDFAVEGDGFFRVEDEQGNFLYTRDGEFHFNTDGTLVTKDGLVVLADAGPVTIEPDQGPFAVSRDGTITQGDNQLGQFPLYEFEDPTVLSRVEGGYFEGPEDAAELVEDVGIVQGAIEGSNVAPMAELVSLIMVTRAYEAAQRAMRSHDDIISKAINSLGSPNS